MSKYSKIASRVNESEIEKTCTEISKILSSSSEIKFRKIKNQISEKTKLTTFKFQWINIWNNYMSEKKHSIEIDIRELPCVNECDLETIACPEKSKLLIS